VLAVSNPRKSRKAIWVTLGLLLAIAFVVAGLIAGNNGDGKVRGDHLTAGRPASVAEQELREGWGHAAEEEQRERERSPTGESKWEELNR
jgi:hypothetical protein